MFQGQVRYGAPCFDFDFDSPIKGMGEGFIIQESVPVDKFGAMMRAGIKADMICDPKDFHMFFVRCLPTTLEDGSIVYPDKDFREYFKGSLPEYFQQVEGKLIDDVLKLQDYHGSYQLFRNKWLNHQLQKAKNASK